MTAVCGKKSPNREENQPEDATEENPADQGVIPSQEERIQVVIEIGYEVVSYSFSDGPRLQQARN